MSDDTSERIVSMLNHIADSSIFHEASRILATLSDIFCEREGIHQLLPRPHLLVKASLAWAFGSSTQDRYLLTL